MEIGPISAIRPAAPAGAPGAAPDVAGVFAVDFRKEPREDTYCPRKAARGLEDEDAEEEPVEAEPESASSAEASAGSISLFA